jgi:fructuronate reductase
VVIGSPVAVADADPGTAARRRLSLDRTNDAVRADTAALQRDLEAPVISIPARLAAGLFARRSAGGAPITILPCDNLPERRPLTAAVVRDLVADVENSLLGWIDENFDFARQWWTALRRRRVRRTAWWSCGAGVRGRGSGADRAVQRMRGQREVPRRPACLVRIGRPSGRDVTPYDERKLWLLNGSHSLLAYAGSIRGHTTIDEAIADPECRSWVEQFWAEAGQYLTLGRQAAARVHLDAARAVQQSACPAPAEPDRLRTAPGRCPCILPTHRAERAAGRMPIGCATGVAASVLHLRGQGAQVKDEGAAAGRQPRPDCCDSGSSHHPGSRRRGRCGTDRPDPHPRPRPGGNSLIRH